MRALGIRRRLLLLLLPSLAVLMFVGALIDYRMASLRPAPGPAGQLERGGTRAVPRAPAATAEAVERRAGTRLALRSGRLLVDFVELDVALLVVWLAIYFGLRPLDRLAAEVEQHPVQELRRFDEARVPAELRALVVAFNRALELLQDAAMAQRRFVADAAHQLRTPVAGLAAQVELLLADPRAAPLAADLGVLERGIRHLAHTANQLLALARAEPALALHGDFRAVPLKPLVEQLVERHLERADQAGIDLGAEAQAATVQGDAWLLEDLLGNLIDNALKYTPRGGHVTVRCGVGQQGPWLEVEDDGPGIPPAERARVRERFYRPAGTRGMGCGLGLAIVDEIARAHRARLLIADAGADGEARRGLSGGDRAGASDPREGAARSRAAGGARLRVQFPAVTHTAAL